MDDNILNMESQIETLDTPMYVMDTINHEGIKLKVIVVELPVHEFLAQLDMFGHFQPAIFNQIYDTIIGLNNLTNNNKLVKDYDYILLSFIKHYNMATRNIFVKDNLSDDDPELIEKYMDTLKTNNIIKNMKPIEKYKILAFINSEEGAIVFASSDKDNDVSKWEELSKFYL